MGDVLISTLQNRNKFAVNFIAYLLNPKKAFPGETYQGVLALFGLTGGLP
jgi:hypothetical protein